MKKHLSRLGWTPTETALVGCGTIALVFVVCCGVAVYFAVRNSQAGNSTDPKEIRAWLHEEVKTEPPKGYECVRGNRFNAIGSTVCTIVIAKADAPRNPSEDFDPKSTTFLLMRAPMADQAAPDPKGDPKRERTVQKSSDYLFDVAGKKATGIKREVTERGIKRLEYQLGLRKNLLLLVAGPAEGFDEKAMNDFLGTMILDQPFDLPTAVRPPDKMK